MFLYLECFQVIHAPVLFCVCMDIFMSCTAALGAAIRGMCPAATPLDSLGCPAWLAWFVLCFLSPQEISPDRMPGWSGTSALCPSCCFGEEQWQFAGAGNTLLLSPGQAQWLLPASTMRDYQCCSILVTDMTNPSYYFLFPPPQNCQLSFFFYDPSLTCWSQMEVGDHKQPYY